MLRDCRTKILGLLVAAAATFCSASALGQESESLKSQQAQRHADEGARLYAEGEYGAALVQFRKAHALKPNRILLFNIALSYSKIGRCGKATTKAAELEAKYDLPPKLRATSRGMSAGCGSVGRAPDVAEEVAEARKRARAERSAAENEGVERAEVAEAANSNSDPHEAESTGSGLGALGWTGVTAAGLGTAGWVATLVLQNQVQSDFEQYETAAEQGEAERYRELRDQIRRKQTAGRTLLVTSIGLTSAGLGLFLFDLLGNRNERRSSAGVRFIGSAQEDAATVGLEFSFD